MSMAHHLSSFGLHYPLQQIRIECSACLSSLDPKNTYFNTAKRVCVCLGVCVGVGVWVQTTYLIILSLKVRNVKQMKAKESSIKEN